MNTARWLVRNLALVLVVTAVVFGVLNRKDLESWLPGSGDRARVAEREAGAPPERSPGPHDQAQTHIAQPLKTVSETGPAGLESPVSRPDSAPQQRDSALSEGERSAAALVREGAAIEEKVAPQPVAAETPAADAPQSHIPPPLKDQVAAVETPEPITAAELPRVAATAAMPSSEPGAELDDGAGRLPQVPDSVTDRKTAAAGDERMPLYPPLAQEQAVDESQSGAPVAPSALGEAVEAAPTGVTQPWLAEPEPPPTRPVPPAAARSSPDSAGMAPSVPAQTPTTPQQGPDEVSRKVWLEARHAFWQNDLPAAASRYQVLNERLRGNADVLGELGNVYFAQGKQDLANESYYQAALVLIRQGRLWQIATLAKTIEETDLQRSQELRRLMRERERALVPARMP